MQDDVIYDCQRDPQRLEDASLAAYLLKAPRAPGPAASFGPGNHAWTDGQNPYKQANMSKQ